MQRQRISFYSMMIWIAVAWALFLVPHSLMAAQLDPPWKRGGFDVNTGEYKFPAVIDQEILASAPTELWARAFWPKDLSQPRPIVFFLHGNHNTCGLGDSPRKNAGCAYTHSGTCPDNTSVIPNHEGFNYLASHLASLGFIAVTINANRGITCGGGRQDDWGLNLARGRLILRHIELWRKWSTSGGAAQELGIPADAFLGAVDLKNVGLFGHSRGGEGARAAYNLYRDPGSVWATRIPDLEIKGIFEIGAVDGQTFRELDADDTAWNQLLPMCDGDVDDLQGRLPFERMLLKTSERVLKPKSLYMAWGTNHNFFNSEWHTSESHGCVGHQPIFGNGPTSEPQQKIALHSVTSFFLAHVGNNRQAQYVQAFDPLYAVQPEIKSITRIDRDYIETFDLIFNTRLEEFNKATGTNSNGPSNEAKGIEVEHQDEIPKRASIKWQSATQGNFIQINWAQTGDGLAFNAQQVLNFRVSRQMEHEDSAELTDFTIQLVDSNGALLNALPVSLFAEVLGPANFTALYQTVRIPYQAFRVPAGTKIKGVRFTFDRSPSGAIYLANLRMSSPFVSPLLKLAKTDPLSEMSVASEASGKIGQPSMSSFRPARRKFERARLVSRRLVPSSSFMSGDDALEVTIRAEKDFPVGAHVPVLIIDGKRYRLSRMPEDGSTNQLIFTLPSHHVRLLKEDSSIRVEYGRGSSSRIWLVE